MYLIKFCKTNSKFSLILLAFFIKASTIEIDEYSDSSESFHSANEDFELDPSIGTNLEKNEIYSNFKELLSKHYSLLSFTSYLNLDASIKVCCFINKRIFSSPIF